MQFVAVEGVWLQLVEIDHRIVPPIDLDGARDLGFAGLATPSYRARSPEQRCFGRELEPDIRLPLIYIADDRASDDLACS
jgi:hypothetical protein